MRALVRHDGGVGLQTVASPRLERDDDVIVQVELAGICRTDIYVARGRLPVAEPRVLGHEFTGVVAEAGPTSGYRPGERVTAVPSMPCGRCASCAERGDCVEPLFMGVHVDGAFAERVRVPGACLRRVPDTLAAKRAAFTEPVAAALAVLNAPLEPAGRGLVLGDNRIATLVARILQVHGFTNVCGAAVERHEEGLFDFIIETEATADSLAAMFRLLRPRGLGVLKSRPASTVPIDVAQAVRKNLRLQAVEYGSFDHAIELLSSGRLDVDDLLAESFPLEDYEQAFLAAETCDSAKTFFSISPGLERVAASTVARLAHA